MEKYVKNMGVSGSIDAQHWTEKCGGMSACLHHNPLFSLTTSFWGMNILDWNSAHSLIRKMNLLEQVWAECWQLSLSDGGRIRKNSFPHNCPPPFSTFLGMTWMKYSWDWHAKLERERHSPLWKHVPLLWFCFLFWGEDWSVVYIQVLKCAYHNTN